MPERVFRVRDRVAFENLGYFSAGTVCIEHPNGRYSVIWDDGFTDKLNDDGTEYTYDGWDLVPLSEVDPALIKRYDGVDLVEVG